MKMVSGIHFYISDDSRCLLVRSRGISVFLYARLFLFVADYVRVREQYIKLNRDNRIEIMGAVYPTKDYADYALQN